MSRSRKAIVAILACVFIAGPAVLRAASPQEAAPQVGQVLHIFVGKSVVINLQAPLTRVLSSNPAVIETLATSPTQVVVEGKSAGSSSLILWNDSGQSQMLDVIVDLDVAGLRTAIEHAYPGQQIAVQADAGRVLLSGNATSQKEIDDVTKMAGLYSTQVVSSLVMPVTHDRQVLLEVKFAEVDRTKLDQLGINILSTGAANTPGTVSTQQFSAPTSNGTLTSAIGAATSGFTSSLALSNLLNIFLFRPDLNLGATIQDLQEKSVLEILASPNLLALNGQKASFLSGGEFPFPVAQSGSAGSAPVITIQFRPFGVKLDFTAFVGDDNVIRLHVAPEVSTLDFTNAVTISGFTIPALSTRRAETEIELKDGQSFGIAGLLDRRTQAEISKIPGIGDIPILGQLFHSKSITRSNSELIVLVTPRIVDPVRVAPPAPVLPVPVIPYMENPKFDKDMPSGKPSAGGSQSTPQK